MAIGSGVGRLPRLPQLHIEADRERCVSCGKCRQACPMGLYVRAMTQDWIILGLFAHEDMTGYVIKKRIDHEISFFLEGGFGSICPALDELLKAGQVERTEDEPPGGRENIRYRMHKPGNGFNGSGSPVSLSDRPFRYRNL